MTKEVFIALIQKDIRELEIMTQGLYETETLSPSIIKLASSKAQEVIENLQKLSEIKKEEPIQPIIEEERTSEPIEERMEEMEPAIVITEETTIIEEVEIEPVEPTKNETLEATITATSTEEKEKNETPEQKAPEKFIISTKETRIQGISKPKGDSFASTIANKKIDDLKKAISIADRFRFQRELFGNNANKMNETFAYLNSSNSMEDAEAYLSSNFEWQAENENVEDFINQVKRLFV